MLVIAMEPQEYLIVQLCMWSVFVFLCVPSRPLSSGSTEPLRSGKWMSDFFLATETPPLLPKLQRSERKERSQFRLLSDT